MSIAPSEHHLENWIYNNFNRFGEVYDEAFELPDYATEGWHWLDEQRATAPFYDAVISRQQRFPFGRADLITTNASCVAAVEIKAGAVTFETVTQCIRYMHELKQIWGETMFATMRMPDAERYQYTRLHEMGVDSYPQSEIAGMVVGHSLTDNNLLVVCAAADIEVVLYDHTEQGYIFTRLETELDRQRTDEYRSHINGPLGKAMRDIMARKAQAQRRNGESE